MVLSVERAAKSANIISKHKIAFCGRIQDHPDYPSIKKFLEARKIEPVVLADIPLTDIGGIIPLMEF